nr:hypothetical protein Iba_chr13eCG9440 [Ipomoea batatas]
MIARQQQSSPVVGISVELPATSGESSNLLFPRQCSSGVRRWCGWRKLPVDAPVFPPRSNGNAMGGGGMSSNLHFINVVVEEDNCRRGGGRSPTTAELLRDELSRQPWNLVGKQGRGRKVLPRCLFCPSSQLCRGISSAREKNSPP